MKSPIWSPSPEKIANSNMTSFMKFAGEYTGRKFSSYNELYNWSVTEIENFWQIVWEYSGIIHSVKYNTALSERKMPGAKWFAGARLNFAENFLRFKDDRTAIISYREDSPAIKISYKKLYKLVAKCAYGLKRLGVKKGDKVAAYVSNIPEAVIGMLATTSIGAIWSSSSPDFGFQGIMDRFGQIKPKILFAVESYKYNGKFIDCMNKIENVVSKISEIERVIIIPRFNNFKTTNSANKTFDKNFNYLYFNELIDNTSNEIDFVQLPFDHPVYIMYSSGTTGIPKCIVHGAGGTLLQHFKELVLHTNLSRNDIITYFTTCGWMMWNWLVSSLQTGATLLLYDGSPAYLNLNILWEIIEKEKITIFGTSPKFISICEKSNLVPMEKFNLRNLKTILSTGSPLSVDNFKYVYLKVKNDIQLSSISGGTDIISCFVLGNPNLPVYQGELQCRGLGMKVEAYDDKGNSIIDKKGELVCTAPFPSMPIYFWNDPDGKKYKAAYFENFPGIWRHGDFIEITETGGVIIYGRSDATLNPGGVRIGTAEIYRVVEAMDEISDSIVVGQNWKNDVRIILFVVLKDGKALSKELTDKIKSNIKNFASPRHVPANIFQVKNIPRTISGKKVELAVANIINGKKVENKDAIANPESLEEFKNYISPFSI